MLPEVQNRDGALYIDLTPSSLGLPLTTPLCHIPISYGDSWEDIGKYFENEAKATCPVDTGYLRDHIGYRADDGGCELWSDAPYSIYQEYGTSRMAAQPYFESSVVLATNKVEGTMRAKAEEYSDMDEDLFFLRNLQTSQNTIEECEKTLSKLDEVIFKFETFNDENAETNGWVYDIAPFYQAREELEQRIVELKDLQEQKVAAAANEGALGFLGNLFAMVLMAVLSAPFTIASLMLEDVSEGIDYHHHPNH